LKWKRAVEQADAELNKIYQQKRHVKNKIEREETQRLKLKDNCTNMKKNLVTKVKSFNTTSHLVV